MDFQQIMTFLADLDWKSIAQDVLGKVGTLLVGILAAWLVFAGHLWRFWRGDTDDILVQAHYLVPNGEKIVLAFRTVVAPTTLAKLFDNQGAQRLLRTLADKTSIDEPILKTEGHLGFEVVNDILNFVSGSLAVSSHPRTEHLLIVTCEDRRVAKKKCIRVFLIRPEDLTKFEDWEWCQSRLVVTAPWHFFRIWALHQIALERIKERSAEPASAGPAKREQLLVEPRAQHPRIRSISLGLPPTEISFADTIAPDWTQATAYLRQNGSKIRT